MAAAKRSSSWLRGLFTRRSRRDEDEESEGGQEREYSDGLGRPLLEREDSEDEERKPEKESFEVGMAPSVSSSMALSEKNDAAEVIMRQLNFRILPTLFCFAFLIAVFQQNIKYSASGMIEDLEMDTQRFGAALSAFYLPSALLQLPTSMLAKRIGIKVYCAVLLTSWGIASLCMCFVRNFTGLMLLRFCLGCVSSGMNPVFSSYVSLFYGRSFAKAWARSWSLGMPVGNLLGGPLAATLLVITGRWEFLYAWQFLFLIWAVPFFLVGVLAATRFPTSPQHCHFLDEDEQLWLLSKTNAAQEDKKRRSGKLAVAQSGQEVIWKLMCDPRVICLSLSRFMRTVAVNGLNFYIPLILSDDGKRSMSFVALLDTIPIAMGLIFNQIWAWHSDKTQERVWHAIIGLLLTCIGQATLAVALHLNTSNVLLTVFALTIAKCGGQGFMTPMRALQSDIFPRNSSHAGFAIINTVGTLGGIVGPAFIGYLHTAFGTYSLPLAILSGCVVVSGLFFLPLVFLSGSGSQPAEEKEDDSRTLEL